jgi:hypothetical protein
MAIPNPVTYADINAKIAEVDNDLAAYNARQGAFVASLSEWINYFVYSLRDVQVAAAIAAAAAAGDIDPAQGDAIYRKFMEVQEALQRANSDADRLAIFDSLRQFEPVLRKLPIGDAAYNGLPPGFPAQPANYPNGPVGLPPPAPLPIGPGGGGGGGPAAAPVFPPAPSGPIVPLPIALSMADRVRADALGDEADAQPDVDLKPTVTLESGRQARITDVFRDSADPTKVVGFQVKLLGGPAGAPDVYRRIRFGGRRSRRKNRNTKKRGGYKSRKSRRRTFR